MSDERAEWIKCIAHTHAGLRWGNPWKPDGTRDEGHAYLAWCGRDVRHEFSFTSIDHALYSVAQGDHLVACKGCIAAINEAAQAAAEGRFGGPLAKLLEGKRNAGE